MKCACNHECICDVGPQDALERQGQLYCSEACAEGHRSGQGCGHAGCHC